MISNITRMSRLRRIRASIGVLSLFVLIALVAGGFPAFGQGSNGEILGAVTDQSGGNVVGATVTITENVDNRPGRGVRGLGLDAWYLHRTG
jgi:hypothetical protein